MDIIKAYATKNLCYIAAQKMVPKGIVVHSTGANNPYLKRYVDCPEEVGVNRFGNHWNTATPGGRKVCVHAFIGYDKNNKVRIAEILPLDICCWGVGGGSKGSFNYDPSHIQFEICEDDKSNAQYYRKAFDLAAEYCAYLCKKFGFVAESIIGHYEAYKLGYGNNHSDPKHWMRLFGEDMDDFRSAVAAILNKEEADKECGENKRLSEGDLVSIAQDATYYNGQAMPEWVKAQKWYVCGTPQVDRVVIDKNESGSNYICSAVNSKYLTVINKKQKTHKRKE